MNANIPQAIACETILKNIDEARKALRDAANPQRAQSTSSYPASASQSPGSAACGYSRPARQSTSASQG